MGHPDQDCDRDRGESPGQAPTPNQSPDFWTGTDIKSCWYRKVLMTDPAEKRREEAGETGKKAGSGSAGCVTLIVLAIFVVGWMRGCGG